MPRVAVPTSKTKCVREKKIDLCSRNPKAYVVEKVDENEHSINS
jgi:hypothetical protein